MDSERHNPLVVLTADEIGRIQWIPRTAERGVPSPASRANPGRVQPEVRAGLLLPHAERVPPALVRWGRSDEACGDLAGVSEGRSGGVSHRPVGQSDLGRGKQPLDGAHSSVGQGEQGATVLNVHSCESPEPGGASRRGPPNAGDSRGDVHDPRGRGPGARLGGPLSK